MLGMLREHRTTTLIFLLVLILLGFGLSMVYSSSAVNAAVNSNKNIVNKYEIQDQVFPSFHSPALMQKQAIWIGIGMLALFVLYSVNYEAITRHHRLILLTALTMLVLVLLVGSRIKGAKRWIGLGPMNFQPSEFAKLAIVIYMSKFLFDNKERLDSFKHVFLPCVLVMGLVLSLVILEPDFGATVVLFVICLAIWFIGGMPLRYILLIFLSGIPPLVGLAVIAPYRLKRILAFLNPDADPLHSGWQINQSLISLGSGGISGKGMGLGMQKNGFLSESHNDYIFAIIGEELGLIGTVATLILFSAMILMFFWVAYRAIDYQGALLAGGLGSMIAIPALVHIGVCAGVLPPKGLSLPFISYGGSSMIVNLAAVGILMNIARSVDKQAAERTRLSRVRRKRAKTQNRPAPMWVQG